MQLGLLAAVLAPAVRASDLLQVYKHALLNDQTFKEATGTWNSQRQQLQIANAALLPTFSMTGNITRQFNEDVPLIPTDTNPQGWNWSRIYTVNLTQPIFNLPFWRAIKGARDQVKAAAATYAFAAQDLMFRTARAYLEVMKAYDILRFTLANKMAVKEQLDTARQQFAVGLIAITGVYEAQSSYDQTVAAEISNKNDLNARIEDLRVITGHYYKTLTTIKDQVPLAAPVPNDINQWSTTASKQNFNLQAQYYLTMQLRQQIRQISSQRYPTANAVMSWSSTFVDPVASPFTRFDNATAGFELAWTPFRGGGITAETRQAMYNYLASTARLDFVHRDVYARTRQAFFSVVAGISQIRADRQVVIASRNAFEATRAGYDVGTRTMVDVLQALTTLFQAEQRYYIDQYDYLINTVDLKLQTGVLSADDLKKINAMFKRRVAIPETMKKYRRLVIGERNIKARPSAIGGISIPDLPRSSGGSGRPLPSRPLMRRRTTPYYTPGRGTPSTPTPSTPTPSTPSQPRTPSTPATPQDNSSGSQDEVDSSNKQPRNKSQLEQQLEQRRKRILERLKRLRQQNTLDDQSQLHPLPIPASLQPIQSTSNYPSARERAAAPSIPAHLHLPAPAVSHEGPDVVLPAPAPQRIALPLPAATTVTLPSPTASESQEIALPAPVAMPAHQK